MNSILIHEAAVKPLGHLRKRKTNGDSYEFIQIKTPLSVKLLRPGPCPFRRSPADCVMDTATSSCCCTSHRPHLEKICKQAGGSRSLTTQTGRCGCIQHLFSKVTIAAAGGIQHVLSAMTGHSGDADVQYAALRTLSSLALGNKGH